MKKIEIDEIDASENGSLVSTEGTIQSIREMPSIQKRIWQCKKGKLSVLAVKKSRQRQRF